MPPSPLTHPLTVAVTAAVRPLPPYGPTVTFIRRRNESTLSWLQSSLKARRLPVIHDYLSPTPYHLLRLSLADFLPSLPLGNATPPDLPSIDSPKSMPQGCHLVYFAPQIPESLLLPDGTDPLQSPGAPWVRRLWAGGSVKWNSDPARTLRFCGQRAVCIESITDVVMKGKGEAEKVFVTIERRMGEVEEGAAEEDVRRRLSGEAAAVVEKRIIAFMRERTAGQAAAAAEAQGKVLKPAPHSPTFTHTLHPSVALLFRFSALTFNAHKIHLDTTFCRSKEGHRNLLVHGPLQLVLLLLLLRKAPGVCDVPDATITEIEYKNLSPLYAEEPLKICGRATSAKGMYELWAETPAGGYAVKATARVGKWGDVKEQPIQTDR
ncbi:MAG: hypothetical protein M1840_006290 [Geoglossum simile]|nr:MAG: hypothetical protein M1840_006290 [Geoglossum simile]